MAVIGIDLGTTNSLAAYWKDGEAHLIPNRMGEYLTPSVVSYVAEQKKMVVGALARERLVTHKEGTRASFKRFMGTEKEFYLGETSYSACELSALVLGKIKAEAELYLGEAIEEAVVTVPAYFNDKQRSDTKKAAQLAGLCVKRLINEPSAAALAYRTKYHKQDMSLLVFDFGGGTLDLSLVECFDDVVEIVGIVGDNYLGGDDIDACIAQWFCKQKQWEFDSLSLEMQQQLLKQCELAKAEFSEKQHQVMICMDTEQAELTEETLFEICMPLFSKIKTLFLRVLKDCGFCISEIDDLIMVGGSSQLPVVQTFLKELLGKAPIVLAQPDQVVALGAGVYAGIRERKEDIRDMVLTDVCPFTLGVGSLHNREDMDEHLTPIIERNSTLPAKGSVHLVSVHDYQNYMAIPIYQGEEYRACDNLFLGELQIEIPPLPAGEARVEVCFLYDLNGILQAEAVNSEGVRRKILLANRDLTEEERKEALEKLQQLVLEEEPLEIKMQRNEMLAYYEQAVGVQREQLAQLLGWYDHEVNSGKQYRQKRAAVRMEQVLAGLRRQDEQLEQYLFDNEE